MASDEVIHTRDRLVAWLCTLAAEVAPDGTPPPHDLEQALDALRPWGRIPEGTLSEIRQMYSNLDTLAGLDGLPALQAKMAIAPTARVNSALEMLTGKVRAKRAESQAPGRSASGSNSR